MFSKSDLQNKMIVVTRNRERFFVVDDIMVSLDGYFRLDDYTDDLLHIEDVDIPNSEFHIIEVWKSREDNYYFGAGFGLLDVGTKLDNNYWRKVYERQVDVKDYEHVDMTLDEICKELKRFVRIVP